MQMYGRYGNSVSPRHIAHIFPGVIISVYIFNMPLLFEQLVMSKSNWSCVWEKYIETIRC